VGAPAATPGLRPRGFTLIEILVVLVIVGVVVAAVGMSVAGSGARQLENAARRAQALVALACERAVLGGRDLGFAAVEGGLRFGYFELDGWHELVDNPSDELRPRALGEGVELSVERDGERLVLSLDAPVEPPFACLSSGELTPFALELSRSGVAEVWRLEGRLDATLTLESRVDAR
jgi:general secretion pathway protein H